MDQGTELAPPGEVVTWSVSDAVASLAAAGTDAALEVLIQSTRLASTAEALTLAALAVLEQHARGLADELELEAGGGDDAMSVAQSSVAAEVAIVTPMSPRTAEGRLAYAGHVAECLPRTWAALAAGDLDPVRVRRIADGTVGLDADVAGRVEDMVIDRAVNQTPTQVARAVTRARLTVDPDARDHGQGGSHALRCLGPPERGTRARRPGRHGPRRSDRRRLRPYRRVGAAERRRGA